MSEPPKGILVMRGGNTLDLQLLAQLEQAGVQVIVHYDLAAPEPFEFKLQELEPAKMRTEHDKAWFRKFEKRKRS
jgi:hypothetical protein